MDAMSPIPSGHRQGLDFVTLAICAPFPITMRICLRTFEEISHRSKTVHLGSSIDVPASVRTSKTKIQLIQNASLPAAMLFVATNLISHTVRTIEFLYVRTYVVS